MPVVQRIDHMAPPPATDHEAQSPQQAELMRGGGRLEAGGDGQIIHRALALTELSEDPDAARGGEGLHRLGHPLGDPKRDAGVACRLLISMPHRPQASMPNCSCLPISQCARPCFTAAAAALLVAAIVVDPAGAVSSSGTHSGLYLVAALVGSVYIWWSAIQGIRARDFTADIPVSLATIAALSIGQYSAAAVVAVLLLVGGLLEEFVAARAEHALDDLETLLPDRVRVRRPAGDVLVALAEVRPGDHVLVRPGERIAIDGEVRAGGGAVAQAAITGESVPSTRSRATRSSPGP